MKRFMIGVVLIVASSLLIAAPAHAGPNDFYADFSSAAGLYHTTYEGGARYAHDDCGVDACASLESEGGTDFLRVAIKPSATPGYYTNADVTQLDMEGSSLTDTGPYTATYGHPVTLSARIKWSATYDFHGAGSARGTSGVVLWNSAFDSPGDPPNGEYDQIGFMWANNAVLSGAVAGFNATSFVDQVPVGVSKPSPPVNIRNWMDVSMVWSVDAQGAQSAAYYLGNTLFGQHSLPAALEGLSLEIWTDNQEPYLCPTGVCFDYPNPTVTQSLFLDEVSVTQA
jgi:hypothetical protein